MGKRLKVKPTHLHMSPIGIQSLASNIWGENWRAPLCDTMGISYSQLHRYMTIYQGQGVPKPFAIALVALHSFKAAGKAFPDMAKHAVPLADAEAVVHVQQAKPKPVKVRQPDAPDAGLMFGAFADPEPAPAPVKASPVKRAAAAAKKVAAKATAQAKKAPQKPAKASAAPTAKKPAKAVQKPAKVKPKAAPAKTSAKAKPKAKAKA